MILTHGSNSISRGGDENSVEIGGRTYPVVRIGNQLWMAENLDWKWNGLGIGGSVIETSDPHAWYYNNDEATYGVSGNKYGLLYNHGAVEYLMDIIPTDWKIPSLEDLQTLGSNSASSLKSISDWLSTNGTNETGFNAYPCGSATNNTFEDIGYYYNLWSCSRYSSYQHNELYIYNNLVRIGEARSIFGFSVRLVKDVT